MTNRLLLVTAAALALALAACDRSSTRTTPPATSAPASQYKVTPPTEAAGTVCGEAGAALVASDSNYAGWGDETKPLKSADGDAGFAAKRMLPGATACEVITEHDEAYRCTLAADKLEPAAALAVLKEWETKLAGCSSLQSLKKSSLGQGTVWSDEKMDDEHTLSLVYDDVESAPKLMPILVVRLLE